MSKNNAVKFRELPRGDQDALIRNIFGAASRWLSAAAPAASNAGPAHTPGRKIAILREFRGWTQSELASRAGVTQSDVSRVEKAFEKGSLEVLLKITNALGVSVEALTDGHVSPGRTGQRQQSPSGNVHQ